MDREAWGYSPWGHKESDTTERLTYIHRLVIAFLPRNKHLLISWLQSPSVVILEPNKIKANLDRDTMKMIGHEIVGIPSLTDAKTLMLF